MKIAVCLLAGLLLPTFASPPDASAKFGRVLKRITRKVKRGFRRVTNRAQRWVRSRAKAGRSMVQRARARARAGLARVRARARAGLARAKAGLRKVASGAKGLVNLAKQIVPGTAGHRAGPVSLAPLPGGQTISDIASIAGAVYEFDMSSFKLPPGYKLLHGVKRSKSSIQAIAVEHTPSGNVVIALRGTRPTDPTDILADIGIAARNIAAIAPLAYAYVVEYAKKFGKGVAKVAKTVGSGLKKVAKKIGKFFTGKKDAPKKGGNAKAPAAEADGLRPVLFVESKGGNRLWRYLRKFVKKLFTAATLRGKERESKQFVTEVLSKVKRSNGTPITRENLLITGHSLGGYLAQVAGDHFRVRTETFNAPGARHGDKNTTVPINNHVRRNDVVGRLGRHLGRVLLYPDVSYKLLEPKLFLLSNHNIPDFITLLRKVWKRLLPGR